MKVLVIYQSKSGYSKTYAEWIAEALEGEVLDLSRARKMDLSTYDRVIFGGGVYASSINGLKKFREISKGLKSGNLSIFAVGASPPGVRNEEQLIEKNLADWTSPVAFFYFQGGFDPQKLNLGMKFVLTGVARILKRKLKKYPETLTDDDRKFLDFFNSEQNHSDPGQIRELVDFIQRGKNLQKQTDISVE